MIEIRSGKPPSSFFPTNYAQSRERFCQAACALGAEQYRYPIEVDGGCDLSIDVAIVGSASRSAIVLTSGLHGVEGHFGAAVQLAWLDRQLRSAMPGRFILIHALNPYGFACGRRVNENNIDLNRNFVLNDRKINGETVVAASSNYARFHSLLNPEYPPRFIDGFYPQAITYIAREGKRRLINSIVTGQYEFKRGLFYGGDHPSQTMQVVKRYCQQWVGGAENVCHIDFHTGLGGHGKCQLLVDAQPHSLEHRWFESTFLGGNVVSTSQGESDAYAAQGAMGAWLAEFFTNQSYRFVTAEFGTYPGLKVLGALRRENQAFHFSSEHSVARSRARKKLEKCFCPPSTRWRNVVVPKSLVLIEQAASAINQMHE